MDEPGDSFKLCQLLLPGLRPNIVCWYVSSPVDPVPRSCSGSVFQQVLNRTQRQVTFAVGSPVPGLPPPPAGKAWVFTATQRFFALRGGARFVLLKLNMIIFYKQPDPKCQEILSCFFWLNKVLTKLLFCINHLTGLHLLNLTWSLKRKCSPGPSGYQW